MNLDGKPLFMLRMPLRSPPMPLLRVQRYEVTTLKLRSARRAGRHLQEFEQASPRSDVA